MVGIEKIPKQGPALLIIYHGYLPLDGFFLLSKILLDLDRKVVTIVEKLNDKIPCIDKKRHQTDNKLVNN
jgi:hypothetical protein